jgi:hypothetical protein
MSTCKPAAKEGNPLAYEQLCCSRVLAQRCVSCTGMAKNGPRDVDLGEAQVSALSWLAVCLLVGWFICLFAC